jgi:tetratricopeptide (TPR) repeat protein
MKSQLVVAGLGLGLGLGLGTAQAQKELDTQRGPSSELYIRKRPPAPDAPVLSEELKKLLNSKEKERDDTRLEAIGMLRAFLASNPTGETRADGVFKLAELLWEEQRRMFLVHMDEYARAVEKCNQSRKCSKAPDEPKIDLSEPEKLYRDLHDNYPSFKRLDLVTYLIGFAEKEAGREKEAMALFEEVIARFPGSTLEGDAWMMIGEHWFALGSQAGNENATPLWAKAKESYAHVPECAATSDLALFKTAWCEWKLGDSMKAAADFKKVLDRRYGDGGRCGQSSVAQKRHKQNLAEQALDYLVVVFTEDRSLSAKEVFDFLVSIGGEQYSQDIMIKVAESYGGQQEYERSNEAYRFLVKMAPDSIKAAEYQRAIVGNWTSAGLPENAQDEIKVLLDNFGPNTPWAKAQKNRDALARSLDATESLVRDTAMRVYARAQEAEKAARIKPPDKCEARPNVPKDIATSYNKAAEAFELYLGAFGVGKTQTEHAIELRYYRADILCFRAGKLEAAGDEYLAVARTSPVGKYHKDALKKAIAAFEEARPKDTQGRKQIYEVDKKFGEAIDLYATLFPDDNKEIVGIIFKNGKMFYDYGNYDEAIKRFGLIVTKYPKDPNAGPAGDRILNALAKAQDYENLEEWARKLKTAPSFKDKDKQELLSNLIVTSIQKSGDKYADAGKYEQAAGFYLRVPKETSDGKVAAQAMTNAAAMYEKAKRPEDAADIDLELAQKYAKNAPELAEKAAFSAGQVYERAIYYDRAAKAYELLVNNFKNGAHAADALFNAGVLRQALGQHKEAIAHYKAYAERFKERKDAADVAFNIGVVYEEAGQDGEAFRSFSEYATKYASSGKHVVQAHARAGRTAIKLGQLKKAKEQLAAAIALWKRASGAAKTEAKSWAAESRYWEGELVFRDYEKVSLDVRLNQLGAALTKKTKLLDEAEKIFHSIPEFNDLKWATAALYRVGSIYEAFSQALGVAGAKCPPGISEDECTRYQDAINEKVVQIQEVAVIRYQDGYTQAIKMQSYDEYTAKIREALGRVAAQKYPPEREARSKVRTGDRPPKPEFVTEVAR